MKTLQRQPQAERHCSAAPLSNQQRQVRQASPASTAIAASARMKSQRQDHRAAFGPSSSPVQRQSDAEQMQLDEEFAPEVVTQRATAGEDAPNRTGMPDRLKSGIEALSGMDISDVRVHRNSAEPAQLNALAYAQGNEIHLGPEQERHLGHEAWHVVQQRQGRVGATMQMAGMGVNDEVGLEREADLMGEKANLLGMGASTPLSARPGPAADSPRQRAQRQQLRKLPAAGTPVQRVVATQYPIEGLYEDAHHYNSKVFFGRGENTLQPSEAK